MNQLSLYIHTFGCQMNEHDSQRIRELLAARGYRTVDRPEEASLIVLNTCSVRAKAEQKVLSLLGTFKGLKQANPDLIIAVGGCVAQQEGTRLLRRAPHLDIVFGPDHLAALPDLVEQVAATRERTARTRFRSRATYRFPRPATPFLETGVSAFVTIMKGCDKFCTYCIVPFTRGREVSRPAAEILDEVQLLAQRGVREVTLLGQTVNSYRSVAEETTFPLLLRRVAAVDGIERIRFTSPHPADLTEELIREFAENEKLCPHLHLPVQSGSDRILRAMNRGHTREEYLDKVASLRQAAPHIALSSDIIVGFPGEEAVDFQDTLELIEQVGFDSLFAFAYSPRPGTRAATLPGLLPEEERLERLRTLLARQDEIGLERKKHLVGTIAPVLIDAVEDAPRGRTPHNHLVHLTEGEFHPGQILPVRLTRAMPHCFQGEAA